MKIFEREPNGDSKYFRAMKLVLGFFAALPNTRFSERFDAFEVTIL